MLHLGTVATRKKMSLNRWTSTMMTMIWPINLQKERRSHKASLSRCAMGRSRLTALAKQNVTQHQLTVQRNRTMCPWQTLAHLFSLQLLQLLLQLLLHL